MPRRIFLALHLVLWTSLTGAALTRCGSDTKKEDEAEKSGAQQGAVPADWDGKGDYTASAFEVIDE